MTPNPKADIQLDLFQFPIPTLQVLKAIMLLERKAVTEVMDALKAMSSPAVQLTDHRGKPIPALGKSVSDALYEFITELLTHPHISEVYGLVHGKGGTSDVASFDSAGLKLAFLTFQGLGGVLQGIVGPQMAAQIGPQLDVLTVLTLKTIRRQRNPCTVLFKIVRFPRQDPDTGLPLVGEPEWADDMRRVIAHTITAFLIRGDYVESIVDPMETMKRLDMEDTAPFLQRTARGDQLFLHLQDQIALKICLKQRGPALVSEAETLTDEQVQADLNLVKQLVHGK